MSLPSLLAQFSIKNVTPFLFIEGEYVFPLNVEKLIFIVKPQRAQRSQSF
jgi:hypothetical protein